MSGAAGPRVLVVEDSDAIRTAFTILLEECGYAVTAAASGAEALRLASEHSPALVLLDLGLPDIPGLDVLRGLKEDAATRAVPVVALTGRDDDTDRAALLAAGCAAYLVKPVDTRQLIADLPGYIDG